jgi:hypothetical protein
VALIACFIRVERPERLRGLSEALALAEAAANGSTVGVAAGDLELEGEQRREYNQLKAQVFCR